MLAIANLAVRDVLVTNLDGYRHGPQLSTAHVHQQQIQCTTVHQPQQCRPRPLPPLRLFPTPPPPPRDTRQGVGRALNEEAARKQPLVPDRWIRCLIWTGTPVASAWVHVPFVPAVADHHCTLTVLARMLYSQLHGMVVTFLLQLLRSVVQIGALL